MDEDARALERFLGGDEKAFEEIVVRNEAGVRNVAFGILRDRALAEDVAQEAFLAAHRKAKSFRGEGSFRSWLFRIAARRALDEIRRRQSRGEVELEEPEGPSGAGIDARLALGKALSQIRPEHRMALVLREVEGMSYREISETLGWPLGTVESRIHRARLELRALLQEKKHALSR